MLGCFSVPVSRSLCLLLLCLMLSLRRHFPCTPVSCGPGRATAVGQRPPALSPEQGRGKLEDTCWTGESGVGCALGNPTTAPPPRTPRPGHIGTRRNRPFPLPSPSRALHPGTPCPGHRFPSPVLPLTTAGRGTDNGPHEMPVCSLSD